MPFISVVIPCYNSKEYILRSLNALEQQTYKDFEVIVVDDCSTDGTYEFLNKIKETMCVPMKIDKTQKNSGPALARSLGINVAQGTYVAFCDSDDWYDRCYLEKMVEALSVDTDMVFCGHKIVLASGTVISETHFPKDVLENCTDKKHVLTLDVDSLCSIVVRRTIVLKTPHTTLRNGEDMAIIPLMIMKSEKFAFVEECMYNYLCRPGSLSMSANEAVVNSLKLSFEHILRNKVLGYDEEIEYIGIRNVLYGALLNYFKYAKKKNSANRILDDFERNYPHWYRNKYISKMKKSKRVFLMFARKRAFYMLRVLALIHKKITEKD